VEARSTGEALLLSTFTEVLSLEHEQICDGTTRRIRLTAPKKPDAVDIEVGQRIRLHRLQSRLSQTELANELGVTFQQVQKYERGVNRVGAGRLTKIAQVFGVPVTELFGANDAEGTAHIEGRGDQSPLKLLTVPGALRLLRAYGQLQDGRTRGSVLELVENIAGGRRKP
jgi:transcriptional regulator with XRE-family HTH domain